MSVSTLHLTPTQARSLAHELESADEGLHTVTLQQNAPTSFNVLVTLDAGWGKGTYWVDQDGSIVPGGGLAAVEPTDR